MRLSAFRIRNFRSIVDSKWNNLSPDNITSLIGQNESGKTSVLEALKSFYDGVITDDILRSDLSMPELSCEFEVDDACLDDIFGKFKVPEVIASSVRQTKKVMLTRSWVNPKINHIEISGEVVRGFYDTLKAAQEETEKEQEILFSQLDNQGSRLERLIQQEANEIEEIKREYIRFEQSILEHQRQISRARTLEQKEFIQAEIDKLQLNIEHNRLVISQKQENIEKFKDEYQVIYDKVKHSRNAKNAQQKADDTQKHIQDILIQIQNIEEVLPRLTHSKEIKITQQKLDVLRQQVFQTKQQYEKLRQDASFAKAIASNIIKGEDYDESKKKAIQSLSMPNDTATKEDLGRAFFQYCPTFELFEDFSSLLPNRIDLDDLINDNSSVEGFKAAKNFLVIAGVDASFFQQQNNRILKQKIENLNGEITINFQDFWRQNIGKNNKIKIHFDLEHYDFNNPEKRGKPYLEFWIKDSKERLYPKQRSRGVRWFLSFYLELKATAKLNQKNRVLLIDEPGVSLHTRAQEDVLEVFEDIKEDLMILYTTHSPHLIDINKLHRILAVQRAIEDDDTSESVIYNIRTLSQASADTLSPIYALMGARFSEQQFIHKYNNIIVEDNSCYYLLVALFKMVYPTREMYVLPATDVSNIPTLANLLMGWKLDFIILLNGLSKSHQVYNTIKTSIFGNSEDECNSKVIKMEQDKNLFDLFSTIDFKTHLLHQRVGITENNSEYIENNNLSATLLGMEVLNQVQIGKLRLENFDDESQSNIKELLSKITEKMQE